MPTKIRNINRSIYRKLKYQYASHIDSVMIVWEVTGVFNSLNKIKKIKNIVIKIIIHTKTDNDSTISGIIDFIFL